jgi:dynein heavy chain, axonemal
MSKNFSDQGFYEYQTYKWVVLDGDIDAVWIESMNTVMDDNKVLTLVSNERVPLSDAMRMVFEINSLKNATPATVSRAGILFINESDVGWRPFVDSWAAKREDATERKALVELFAKYIDATANLVRKGYKEVTPLRILNKVCTIVYLLEGLLDNSSSSNSSSSNSNSDAPAAVTKHADTLENLFIFALCWAFGGPMVADKSGDCRRKFSEEFSATFPFPASHLPKEGTCFDYYFDTAANAFVEWSSKVPAYTAIPIGTGPGETPFTQLAVATTDTVRLSTLMDLLVRRGKFMMLVGTAGTGKTSLIKEYLGSLDKDADGLLSENMNMSYYTDSAALQQELELHIDKRSGRRFGPPATKKLVYFVDDVNLPYVETYGTQNAIALLTQLVGYGTIFDRADLGFRKEIVDVQFVAAMNPTAGSFEICERLQRHFATFCASMPSQSDLKGIYQSLFSGHLQGFANPVVAMGERVVDAAIALHRLVAEKFLPSAVKFTYNWNMRELSNVFAGMVLSTPGSCELPLQLARLWLHESERVFRDRLLTEDDLATFDIMLSDISKKHLAEVQVAMCERPVVFTDFAGKSGNGGDYAAVASVARLKQVLDAKLQEYNESNAMMDLVLFEQAMEHVTRICRIVQRSSGNAMLIGVGGSGKQSLSRLAAFICGYEVRQLAVTASFKTEDLKEALREMFKTAGVKGVPLMLLMTDGQIVDDHFLISINAILANGWVSDLFAKDEVDALLGALRNEAKSCGIPDTPECMLGFLIQRVKVCACTLLPAIVTATVSISTAATVLILYTLPYTAAGVSTSSTASA